MRFLSVALGGLLLGAAFPALAQTAADAPATPRFYVGLGAYSSFYQPIGHPASNGYSSFIQSSSFRLPVQFTAGYHISPRVAVQVGLAYSTGTSQYGQTFVYSTTTPGTPSPSYTMAGTTTQTQTSVSALARYTLTANPAHRLQFDALGGFTLEHGTTDNQGSRTENLQGPPTTTTYDYRLSKNSYLLTGGVEARYRLSRCLELTYDFTVNKALNSPNIYGGNGTANTLTTSQALGLRYRFGR
ncbi:outer membrane beta-barrel protein [Hymenobacter sp. UYCo722]|uniref:outer membrane beta-barrel protein n=1 Tax=Hymenobacter sp. UYCo722 TaxID=3156335 RepID=UPI0033989549